MKHSVLRAAALFALLALMATLLPLSAVAAGGGDRTIGKLSTPPTIDGVIGDGEWVEADLELNNYQTATVPGDAKKVSLSGQVYLGYDETHFYLAVEAVYDSHENTNNGYDLWKGDALQIQLSADGENDRRAFCFALCSDGTVRGYQSGRETYTGEIGGEFFVKRNEQTKTTTYEIALPLSRFGDGVTGLRKGNDIAFSYAVHMHNGYYYEWCAGIVTEKNIRTAALLTLGDEKKAAEPVEPVEPKPPVEPEFLGYMGDVDRNGKVDTTDARLTLQHAAGKIGADALDTEAANVDGDSKISTTDARLILQFAAKKISEFPAGNERWTEGDPGDPGQEVTSLGKYRSSNTFSPVSEAAGVPFISLDDLTQRAPAGQFAYFALTTEANEGLPFNVACRIDNENNLISAMVPAGVDRTALIPTFRIQNAAVSANGAPVTSDVTVLDMSGDVALTVGERTMTLRVEALDTGLPSVALTTEGCEEIVSKDEYLNAGFYLGGGAAGDGTIYPATTKGRGNSSWKEPKKGYTVKLAEKAQLMDMSESKDWALIANYEDNTLLRNVMAEYLAEAAGLEYVVQNRPVDLWYNGQYWGTYNLTEKIEIEKDRVNITKYEPGCGLGKTGFLMEFDAHVSEISDEQRRNWQRPLGWDCEVYYDPATDEVFMPISIGGKWLTIKKPSYETLTENKDLEQLRYIYDKVNEAIDALRSWDYNRINACLDVTSFAKWYLVEEYMNNCDCSFHSSCYMTLDVGGKLKLGPVWDFDRSSANCDYWNSGENISDLYNSGSAWFQLLFQQEQARKILKEEYASFRKSLDGLCPYLEAQADAIYASQTYNFERWDLLETVVDDGIDGGWNSITQWQQNSQTFEAEIDVLEDFFRRRTAQMNNFIPNI